MIISRSKNLIAAAMSVGLLLTASGPSRCDEAHRNNSFSKEAADEYPSEDNIHCRYGRLSSDNNGDGTSILSNGDGTSIRNNGDGTSILSNGDGTSIRNNGDSFSHKPRLPNCRYKHNRSSDLLAD
jgi:hypothetical protein